MSKNEKNLLPTRNNLVLGHLKRHKYITSMDAFNLYGISRLSAAIYDLREVGHKIGMVWESGTNRYGQPVRYGRYFLIKTTQKGI